MTIKQLTDTISQGLALKLVSLAYTEIASTKLKKIRGQVEKNRDYLNNLSGVYRLVKIVARNKKIIQEKKNKTISILLTSNYHFYGQVNHNLIKFFMEQQAKSPTDSLIVGQTAKSSLPNLPSVILESDYPTDSELTSLVERVKDYQQILICYSELQTVMIQKPKIRDITQNAYLDTPVEGTDLPQIDPAETFIFEPEIGNILDFFETQVTNLLLQQTFLESELSRTASRLVAMDEAQINADKYLDSQKKLLVLAKRGVINSKILQTHQAFRSVKGHIWKG